MPTVSMGYVLTDANIYVGDHNLAGTSRAVTLPQIEEETEEFLGGGMLFPAEVAVAYKPMRAEFEMPDFNPDVLLHEGDKRRLDMDLTVYGYLRSDNGIVEADKPYPGLSPTDAVWETPAEAHMRGRFLSNDLGEWRVGVVGKVKATFICRYYELRINKKLMHRIDSLNRVYIIGGVDQSWLN